MSVASLIPVVAETISFDLLTDNIINCDVLDTNYGVLNIPDNSIDLVLTDVPFGVDFKKSKFFDDSKKTVFSSCDEWITQMYRVLKKGHHCYIYVPTLQIDKWIYSIKRVFEYNNLIAVSTYTTNRYIKNNFTFDLQLIAYCSKGKAKRLNKVDWIKTSKSWYKDKRNKDPKKFTYQYKSFVPKKYRANVKTNEQVKGLHPNRKNQILIEKLILLSSNKKEIVSK